MAHTLSIYDGVTGSTLALASTGSTGYKLLKRQRLMPEIDAQRNSSMYRDGELPVSSKRLNVIEEIWLEIIGSSIDDMFVKLRALEAAVEHDYMEQPNVRQPAYLIDQPQGCTNAAYSVLIGGRVDEPEFDATGESEEGGEGELLAYTMSGVVLTIEREPFWREKPPLLSATVTDFSTNVLNATSLATGNSKVTISGTPGDLPALTRLYVEPSATTAAFANLVAGYRSVARGANPANGGLIEAELSSIPPSSDSSDVADATASGGHKIRTTFATVATDLQRLRIVVNGAPAGSWRVFARMKITAGTASVYLGSADKQVTPGIVAEPSGIYITNAPVTVSATAWTMHDMGIVTIPQIGNMLSLTAATLSVILSLFAARTSGAGSLDIDYLFLLPVDESYLSLAGGQADYQDSAYDAYLYDGIAPSGPMARNVRGGLSYTIGALNWSSDLTLPPGDGYLYILTGDRNWANTLTGNGVKVSLWRVARYATARGNG